MSILIYHFDLPRRFPVLEPDSNTKTPPIVRRAKDERGGFLRVVCERLQSDDTDDAVVVLALPLLGIAGRIERLDLDVLGDSSGTRVSLETIDERGSESVCSFGKMNFSGWRTCHADVNQPIKNGDARRTDPLSEAAGPLQPRKLVFTGVVPFEAHPAQRGRVPGAHPSRLACAGLTFDIGIRTLSAIGDVRLVPTGIA